MSQKKIGVDFTVGEPMKQLILFAIPMLIGAVFQLMYSMVDTIVLGKFVSPEALAAVGSASAMVSLVILVGNALTNGLSIQISQAWGAKNLGKVKQIMGHAFIITLASSFVIGVLSLLLAEPVMKLLGAPENIRDGAVTYIQIVCGVYVAQMFYNTSASVLRAIGDSKTPLYFLILCCLMNIALDIAFVFAFENGVACVAWATVLSQLTSAVLCCVYMWKKHDVLRFSKKDMSPDSLILKEFSRMTLPLVMQHFLLCIGQMGISAVINSFGSDIVAANTVGAKVEQLVTTIVAQVAFSFSVYAGQNYGAKKYDRINLGVRRGLVLLGGLSVVSMAVLYLFGRPLALIFVNAEETAILEAALQMLMIEAAFLPALSIIWMYNSCLRGMGLVKAAVISSIVELISKIGVSVVFSRLFGSVGIWYAAPIGWVLGLAVSGGYFYLGHWKQRALEADAREMQHA